MDFLAGIFLLPLLIIGSCSRSKEPQFKYNDIVHYQVEQFYKDKCSGKAKVLSMFVSGYRFYEIKDLKCRMILTVEESKIK